MKWQVIILGLLGVFSYGQDAETYQEETLTDLMCEELTKVDKVDEGSVRFITEKYLVPYAVSNFSTEEEASKKIDHLFIRLEKKCEIFRQFLHEIDPPKDDNWIFLSERPKSTITPIELKQYKKQKNFYYIEPFSGEKTRVSIENGLYIQHFSDNTYSKTYIRWIDNTQYELEFIESNNVNYGSFSKKGDKYNYEVLSKEDNYFWIFAQIPNQQEMLKFKLYIDK